MSRLIFFLVFGGALAQAAAAPSPFSDVLKKEVRQTRCRERFYALPEIRALESWPALPDFLKTRKSTARGRAALDAWSSDLLLHLTLQLEGNFLAGCPTAPFALALARELKFAYLRQLGLPSPKEEEADRLFRAFLATRDDVPALKEKIKGQPDKSAAALFPAVYGWVTEYRGAMVVSAKEVPLKAFDELLAAACPKGHCPFWNFRVLYKVLVTEHDGLAAYVPETATLVLSRSLVENDKRLHRLVVLHELTHAAIRDALLRQSKDWLKDYAPFSGWIEGQPAPTPVKLAEERPEDELTRGSRGSAFSILPDPLIGATRRGEETFEGFVFGRSYDRVAASADVSEDLADHVAAFIVAPERFCHRGTAIAPKKQAWIAKEIFGRTEPPTCGGKR